LQFAKRFANGIPFLATPVQINTLSGTTQMTATLDDAIALAAKHFNGVTDKVGQPYILHCVRVMMGVESLDAKIVGILHDVVEDTEVTLEDLRRAGFSETVVRGVDLMTHREDVSYADYVVRLQADPIAKAVKLSDLRDNLSPQRVLLRGDRAARDRAKLATYAASYRFLTEKIGEAEYRQLMADQGS
jgi:(p)ppGpp synthase/HD superfamily hydrolase